MLLRPFFKEVVDVLFRSPVSNDKVLVGAKNARTRRTRIQGSRIAKILSREGSLRHSWRSPYSCVRMMQRG